MQNIIQYGYANKSHANLTCEEAPRRRRPNKARKCTTLTHADTLPLFCFTLMDECESEAHGGSLPEAQRRPPSAPTPTEKWGP